MTQSGHRTRPTPYVISVPSNWDAVTLEVAMDRRSFLAMLGVMAWRPEYAFAQSTSVRIGWLTAQREASPDALRHGDARVLDRTGLCRGKKSND